MERWNWKIVHCGLIGNFAHSFFAGRDIVESRRKIGRVQWVVDSENRVSPSRASPTAVILRVLFLAGQVSMGRVDPQEEVEKQQMCTQRH